MGERVVVFNADDLGVSRGTNAGILAAVEAGLVRETSLCVTGLAADEAMASLAGREGSVGVGLHLSLTLGRALTGPLPGITDEEGIFLPLKRVLRACVWRRPDPGRVAEEVRAQIARLRELGVTEISHLNGHHHVHAFPRIRDVVLDVVRQERIPYLRVPLELPRRGAGFSARRTILRRMSRNLVRAGRRSGGMPRFLPFVGIDLWNRADYRERFLATARRLQEPSVEWMVHPRAEDDDFASLDHLEPAQRAHRERELSALTDPNLIEAVRAIGIRPGRYCELTGGATSA